jgi:hypothetical protein
MGSPSRSLIVPFRTCAEITGVTSPIIRTIKTDLIAVDYKLPQIGQIAAERISKLNLQKSARSEGNKNLFILC